MYKYIIIWFDMILFYPLTASNRRCMWAILHENITTRSTQRQHNRRLDARTFPGQKSHPRSISERQIHTIPRFGRRFQLQQPEINNIRPPCGLLSWWPVEDDLYLRHDIEKEDDSLRRWYFWWNVFWFRQLLPKTEDQVSFVCFLWEVGIKEQLRAI